MKENTESLISIIMPVYNGEKFLKESIESILNQTHKNIELIVVNDGSTDASSEIAKEFQKTDTRIKIIDQKNVGIDGALNTGLKHSHGEYIARMDSDDIAFENRLERQLDFMQKNHVLFCGTWARLIDENGQETAGLFNYPLLSWKENKKRLLMHNMFIHPTVMFKRELYEKEKDEAGNLYRRYKNVEDYELWTRFVPKYRSENIPEYLLQYRIHNSQVTYTDNLGMRYRVFKVRILGLFRLFFH